MFHAFSLDHLNGSITHTTGEPAFTTVHGDCSFKVMGQETCQYTVALAGKDRGGWNGGGKGGRGDTVNTAGSDVLVHTYKSELVS